MEIWKYPLECQDYVFLDMPVGAKPLTVQVQNGTPCLWAIVDPGEPKRTRGFRIIGTGHPFYGDAKYIGTFQLHDGELVFHVFEVE